MKPRRQKRKTRRKSVKDVYTIGDDRDPPLERDSQNALRKLMEGKGWLVEKVHGSLTMKGWPDLYCHHSVFGQRWIECKRYGGKSFLSDSQRDKFKKWVRFNIKIWVLRGPDEYDLLFKKPNWHTFLRSFK